MRADSASLLAARAPRMLAWVEAAPAAHVAVSSHGDGATLVVDGVHLASALDPRREAVTLAERCIPAGSPEAWVYGTGTALIEAALARAARVHVVGLCAAATSAELSHRCPAWLGDARVRLLTPEEAPAPRSPRVLASAELRLASPSPLRDALVLELSRPYQERALEPVRAARAARGRANRARYPQDGDVARLFGAGRSWAFVAAGGPSLHDGLAATAARRDAATLIAVTTALAPLERAGVRPDVAIVVDPKPAVRAHLDRLERLPALADVPLVYAVDVDPDLLARWPGPRLAALLDLPGYHELAAELAPGALFCSGTVTHAAVDLAVRMGATDVVLLGADFGYPGGHSHAAGAALPIDVAGRRLFVESVAGGPLPTDVHMLGYLRDLEAYIAARPSLRFWNTSGKGARIAGARSYTP